MVLWTPSYGQANTERPAITYLQQLCVDTGCSVVDFPKAIDDRDKWQGRLREI